MKHKLPLFLAAMCLGASAQAAVLDIGSLAGTFATGYTDSNGITITYSPGTPAAGLTESSGYSGDGGRGMNGLPFPDGHLAVGPGDTVTLDFTSVGPSTVSITFFDLDNTGTGANESATILSAGAPAAVAGDPGIIPNASADTVGVITVSGLVPDNGKIIIQADGIGQGNESGYFAISAESFGDSGGPVVPEPSSSLLALLGLSMVTLRRRRK